MDQVPSPTRETVLSDLENEDIASLRARDDFGGTRADISAGRCTGRARIAASSSDRLTRMIVAAQQSILVSGGFGCRARGGRHLTRGDAQRGRRPAPATHGPWLVGDGMRTQRCREQLRVTAAARLDENETRHRSLYPTTTSTETQ